MTLALETVATGPTHRITHPRYGSEVKWFAQLGWVTNRHMTRASRFDGASKHAGGRMPSPRSSRDLKREAKRNRKIADASRRRNRRLQ